MAPAAPTTVAPCCSPASSFSSSSSGPCCCAASSRSAPPSRLAPRPAGLPSSGCGRDARLSLEDGGGNVRAHDRGQDAVSDLPGPRRLLRLSPPARSLGGRDSGSCWPPHALPLQPRRGFGVRLFLRSEAGGLGLFFCFSLASSSARTAAMASASAFMATSAARASATTSPSRCRRASFSAFSLASSATRASVAATSSSSALSLASSSARTAAAVASASLYKRLLLLGPRQQQLRLFGFQSHLFFSSP